MSAILGVIEKNKAVSEDIAKKLHDSMKEFKVDRYNSMLSGNVYFECGHQYFTREAENDISPYYDEICDEWFVSDCYLINRDELVDKILQTEYGYTREKLEQSGDAFLAYIAYKCFGERFVEYLKGSFSAVIYCAAKQEVLLYADHLAQRYLTYYFDGNAVCFSTLFQPILAYIGRESIKICDKWILSAYVDCTADTVKHARYTAYENIYNVEPGSYARINLAMGKIEYMYYWNPLKLKNKLKKMSDEEYKEIFLKTFERTVRSMIRAKGETGIMLSGGLDSSSVAAFAAIKLAEEGKNLYSYTAVPASDYQYENGRYVIENEMEWVVAQQEMYPNIIPKFVGTDKNNCFTKLKDYVNLFREPVKPALNMVAIDGMNAEASKNGCSIIFSGQNGNATISYGNILTYVYQKCVRGHFWAAYREIKAFCKLRRVSRKNFLKVFLRMFKENRLKKYVFGGDCFLRQSDIKKYDLLRLERKLVAERSTGFIDTRKQRLGFCFMPLVFQHMGFYDTYSSLYYGVLHLDPTLTKDMLELFVQLPIDCHVKNGKERRAVRDYMKGYVTDKILDNYEGRGSQAADFAYRVNRHWDNIKEEVYGILKEPVLQQYLDQEKVNKLIEEIKENEYNLDKTIVAKAAVIASLGYFLKQVNECV